MSDTNSLDSSPSLTGKKWFIIVWAFILVAALHALLTQTHYFLNADVAFLTQIALYGQSGDLYTQYFEINPPLIIYIYRLFLLPYYIGDWSVVSSLRLSMIGYLLIISLLCHYYLVKLCIKQPIIWLLAISLSLLFVLPAAFLQREHIIAAAMLGYLFMMVCRIHAQSCSQVIQWITLTIAGAAICLKPQYAVVLIILDLYYLWLTKRIILLFRWQNLYLVFLGTSYIGYVFFFHPTYFSFVAPLASDTYIAYFDSTKSLITRIVLLLILVSLSYRYLRNQSASPKSTNAIYLLVIASAIAFIIGRAGFSYHLILLFVLLAMVTIASCIYALLQLISQLTIKHLGQVLFFSFLLIFIRQLHFIDIHTINYNQAVKQLASDNSQAPKELIEFNPYHTVYEAVDKLIEPNQGIYAFSARLFVGHPIAIHLGLNWIGRFPVLWPLPESLKEPTEPINKARLKLVANIISNDIAEGIPKVILVEQSDELLRYPKGFDFLTHFNQYPEFVKVFKDYQHSGTYPTPESNWAVYVRK